MYGFNNHGNGNGESLDSRYQTPESFRTRGQVDQQKPPDSARSSQQPANDTYPSQVPLYREHQDERNNMSNPYLDPGYNQPYQISQNRYKEQVFGSSQPEMMQHNRSVPYAEQGDNKDRRPQRPWSDIPPGSYRYPQRDDYDMSPRRPPPEHYEDRTYRSGRPDLGVEKDVYVPYPQEPLHRRKPDLSYMQPPSYGNNTQNDAEEKQKVDLSLEDGGNAHPGWLVLMRFHKDGLDQIQRALYMCQKHIVSDGGKILGLARPYGVRVREGGDNWVSFGRLRYATGAYGNAQQSPRGDDTNYCVLVIYYPSLTRATQWWDRDPSFKQKDFPKPYCSDCIALPLTTRVDTGFNKTLVITEYPRIGDAQFFRDRFAIPTESMMMKRFRAVPYVVKSTYVPTDDTRYRVAHHLRGCWMVRNSIITVSMFDSMQEAYRYFADPEYNECKKHQDRVTSRHAPTVVVLDLEDWRPAVPQYRQ